MVKEYTSSGRTPGHTRGPSGHASGYGSGTFRSSRKSAVRGHKLGDDSAYVGESYIMTDRPERNSAEVRRSSVTEDQRHILRDSNRETSEMGSKDNSITKTTEYSVSTETMRGEK